MRVYFRELKEAEEAARLAEVKGVLVGMIDTLEQRHEDLLDQNEQGLV